MASNPFTSAVEAFEKASPWLGDADLPALVTLRVLAEELDKGTIQAALVSQFTLTYRALVKRAPVAEREDADPLEALLTR